MRSQCSVNHTLIQQNKTKRMLQILQKEMSRKYTQNKIIIIIIKNDE